MHESQKSDLIDRFHHEHHHLTRLFDDLRSTFQKIASRGLDEETWEETMETAYEDLEVGLEDMLHHFDQEEEVFFVEVEKRFPEFADDIARLAQTHEFVCERTRWLQRLLRQDVNAVAEHIAEVGQVLETLQRTLLEHTRDENRIFGEALRRMTPKEREHLLREMQRI